MGVLPVLNGQCRIFVSSIGCKATIIYFDTLSLFHRVALSIEVHYCAPIPLTGLISWAASPTTTVRIIFICALAVILGGFLWCLAALRVGSRGCGSLICRDPRKPYLTRFWPRERVASVEIRQDYI